NRGSHEAVPVLSRALSDPEPLVRAHAAWALGRVGSAEARSALSAHATVERDAAVLEELSAAIDARRSILARRRSRSPSARSHLMRQSLPAGGSTGTARPPRGC